MDNTRFFGLAVFPLFVLLELIKYCARKGFFFPNGPDSKSVRNVKLMDVNGHFRGF